MSFRESGEASQEAECCIAHDVGKWTVAASRLLAGWPCLLLAEAAGCYGAFCAFGFQALNHELMHSIDLPGATALSLVGSGCTLVPWFSYYFSGGHARHHKMAGTPRDIDREAFFWAWERVPASWPT